MKKFIKILLIIILIILMINLLLFIFLGKNRFLTLYSLDDQNMREIEIEQKEFSKLKLELDTIDIKFILSDNFKIETNKTLVYQFKNDTLLIKEPQKIIHNKQDKKLNIYLTHNDISKLDLSLEKGNVELNNFTLEEIDLDIDTGSLIMIKSNIIKKGNILLDTGNATLNGVNFNNTELKIDAGNINFDGQIKGLNTLEVDTGKIGIVLNEQLKKYQIKAETNLGNILLNSEDKGKKYTYTEDNGNVLLNVKADIGNIEITSME